MTVDEVDTLMMMLEIPSMVVENTIKRRTTISGQIKYGPAQTLSEYISLASELMFARD